jgi:subtilisin family serine protease
VELHVFDVIGEDKEYLDEVAYLRSLHAAAIDGIQVLCLSLMGTISSSTEHLLLKKASAAGVTIVCAAGNSADSGPYYPAAFPEVIAVGAVTPTGELASFSGRGEWVNIFAPGVGLPVPVKGAGYSIWNGTSLSCALVAGVVTLMLRMNSELKPQVIQQILRKTATPITTPPLFDGGVVNAFRALEAVREG